MLKNLWTSQFVRSPNNNEIMIPLNNSYVNMNTVINSISFVDSLVSSIIDSCSILILLVLVNDDMSFT
jgi:hypothetical protein